jgi:uncharacterized membrane protein YvbJ
MARTLIAVEESTPDGLDFSIDTLATLQMDFYNTGRELLFVKNAGTASIDVVIDFKSDKYGRDGNKTVSVAGAGASKVIGSFLPGLYNQDNKVLVDFSDVTSVTVKVVKLN